MPKKTPVYDDYERIANSVDPLKEGYQHTIKNIDAQTNQRAQDAYILNEKLKQYLGVVGTSSGQRGLSESGHIQLANQYASSLGGIQQDAHRQKNEIYSSYADEIYRQKQLRDQQNYQEGLIADDRTYQQMLLDKSNASHLSSQRLGLAQEGVYNEYISMLTKLGSNKQINKESAKQALVDYVLSQYGASLNEDDRVNIELYIDTLLSGDQYGNQATMTEKITDDWDREYKKNSNKYAYDVNGQTYYLDFSGMGEGYVVDNAFRRGQEKHVAQAVAYMLEKGSMPSTAEVSNITGVKNEKILENIIKDLGTFLKKNKITMG